jgi:hypothetical protein
VEFRFNKVKPLVLWDLQDWPQVLMYVLGFGKTDNKSIISDYLFLLPNLFLKKKYLRLIKKRKV